jgi:N-acetylmuramoyl-L-alanine amidase
MYTVILDPGHGGIINGKYVTAGKRSPVWSDGTQLFEGVYNRAVCSSLEKLLSSGGLAHFRVVDGDHDTPLTQRVLRANEFYKKDKGCVYVSIHGNAGPPSASGFEVFTSVGQTKSDILASFVIDSMEDLIPNVKWRKDMSDGDKDKEENFYVLRATLMPAILTENGFFTNEAECRRMMDQSFIDLVAQSHYRGIFKYINSQKPRNDDSVDRA